MQQAQGYNNLYPICAKVFTWPNKSYTTNRVRRRDRADDRNIGKMGTT